MKKLIELFVSTLIAAGADPNNEELTALIKNPALAAVTLSDENADIFQNKLFTLESAKHNSDVKKYFFNQAYNGLDSELSRTMDELELDDATKTKILAEKSSTKRAALLVKEVKELESQKKGKGDTATKELTDKINLLQTEIGKLSDTHKGEMDTLKASHQTAMADMEDTQMLAGYKYAGDLPDSVKLTIAKTVIAQEMQKKGLTRSKDENGNNILLKADGTRYFENNKEVDHKTFVESTLAQNKLLQTSGGGNNGSGGNTNNGQNQYQQQNQNQNTQTFNGNGNNGNFPVNHSALAELDAELAQATGK